MNPQAFNPQPEAKRMMDQAGQFQDGEKKETPAEGNEEKPAETKPDAGTTETDAQTKTPMKKVKSKKDMKNDPSRFELPGVNFNAKLIGIDDVESARGDKMCQESMHKLKIAIKTSGQHKQKIIVNVSLDGIRIIDLRTQTTHHSHPVHRISFISRDLTDGRAFGYVFGAGEGKHKFFAIKTEKAAEALVLTLRDLFQVVYDLKKKEVEEAKTKAEEKKEETKEEPVYQVPNKAVPVENGSVPGSEESTYEVPPNNAPVRNESSNLLMLETEMEAIEKRIEQIDTMDELFKELEAPPVTSATPSSSSSGGSWSSDLAGLSTAPPTQPTFSIGGGSFPGAQPWGQQPGFPPQNQPFGAPPQPGNSMMANVPFGGQPAQPNPFGAPGVPPRPGVGFPGQQPGGFPVQQPPAQGFPGTPFPAFQNQQPGFPAKPQPEIKIQGPTNDPFGSDPFQIGDQGFEENILTPAKLESSAEAPTEQPKKKDAFDDLVLNIGSKTERAKSPKDMFSDLSAAPKTSLNELKAGNRTPSPKPQSPFGNQASRQSQTSIKSNVSTSSLPLTSGDPFANDPFASNISTNAASSFDIKSAPQNEHIAPAFSNDSVMKTEVFSDDDFNLPSPDGPPPPLPENIMNQNIKSESQKGPEPPPRPLYNTHHTPPLPPRPGSAHSDSAKNRTNSMIESQPMKQQQTPPLPPRPRTAYSTVAVPRPKPRSSTNKDSVLNNAAKDKNYLSKELEKAKNNVGDFNANTKLVNNNSDINSDFKLSETSWRSSVSSPKIADPFVSTDPFATEDPFNDSDPFTSDPFASDPFSDPMFTSNTQPSNSCDPFTSVVSSPKPTQDDSDPFSVFDNKVSGDAFKFDKCSSKKVKLKGTAK